MGEDEVDLLVLGGGVTGLCAAWQASRQGASVRLWEQKNRLGGSVVTLQEDGYLVEAGPNSMLLEEPALEDFLRELDLIPELVEAGVIGQCRFLVRGGRVLPLPTSPWSAATTPLLSWRGKLRILREPWIPPRRDDHDESLADFVRRRLGDEVLRQLIQPFVSGVYAGDPERLSVRAAFPKLKLQETQHASLIRGGLHLIRQKNRYKKRLVSFRRGIRTLVERIGSTLADRVRLGIQLERLRLVGEQGVVRWKVSGRDGSGRREILSARRVICALPAWQVADLPWEAPWSVRLKELGGIAHPPVVSLALAYRRDQIRHALDGFGMLIPDHEGLPILGTIFSSSLFPDRAPQGRVLLTSFLGGRLHPERAQDAAEWRKAQTHQTLSRLLGIEGEPERSWQTVWDRAIPQFEVGHDRYLHLLDEVEREAPGLTFVGGYRGGVSLGKCILAGLRAGAGEFKPTERTQSGTV